MSTGQSAVTLCGCGVKAGMVHSVTGQLADMPTCRLPTRSRTTYILLLCPVHVKLMMMMIKNRPNQQNMESFSVSDSFHQLTSTRVVESVT